MSGTLKIKHTYVIRALSWLGLIALIIHPLLSMAKGGTGVLIVSDKAEVTEISHQEVRRLFLGLPAEAGSGIGRPLINEADRPCYKGFLKNVMFLTENGYQRKLVKRVFRQGADKIQSFDSEQELIKHLLKNPGEISYICNSDLKKYSGVRVIKVLW